ncbi:MAG: transketolase, partial [Clostridia bacterium]|nr:transketolase [Clostridia bacterium]
MDTATHKELEQKAQRLRRLVIKMIGTAGSGHPGGSLSAAEIISVLYFHELRLDPQRPDWPDRDRFILSKGHAAPLLYAALAERGFFPVDELFTLRRLGSRLQGHPDCRRLPGVEMSTGSLGQGLSVGNGLALAARLDGRAYRVYVLLGDGEVQEGMVWEAGMAAAFWR